MPRATLSAGQNCRQMVSGPAPDTCLRFLCDDSSQTAASFLTARARAFPHPSAALLPFDCTLIEVLANLAGTPRTLFAVLDSYTPPPLLSPART